MVLKKILGLCCFPGPQKTNNDNEFELDVTETAALTTVHCGEKPIIDIVAVHGLNGHAVKSFTAERTRCFWLGDGNMLPRDLRSSRIMTFSYPASVAALFDSTSSDTFLQHATTLAQELAADRSINGATRRPLIFICHSLGGIIAKRALIYAESRKGKKMEHVHALYVSTYAMLFFGTPHNGSSRANLASYAQRMVSSLMPSKVIDTDSQLLNALKDGSEILQEITDNFQPKMKRFSVFFFWEQLKTDLGAKYDYVSRLPSYPLSSNQIRAKELTTQIVTETSAAPILDDTERAGIRAEHRHMCKFASRNSPGYPLVAATLIRYSEAAPDVISRRWTEATESIRIMRRGEVDELVS
ncbi:hypothetical protein PG993_010333 [Apiospora rasikravindrae]|uniref:DUF676 domain-containing protein n=1 Tax=Apiospora rasikravindrae TaxID=990691 RepID=A0ABR1SLY3_9PEZI